VCVSVSFRDDDGTVVVVKVLSKSCVGFLKHMVEHAVYNH